MKVGDFSWKGQVELKNKVRSIFVLLQTEREGRLFFFFFV